MSCEKDAGATEISPLYWKCEVKVFVVENEIIFLTEHIFCLKKKRIQFFLIYCLSAIWYC